MADETQKPTMDGIRPTRSLDGVARTQSMPQTAPAPQPVAAPVPAPVVQPSVQAAPLPPVQKIVQKPAAQPSGAPVKKRRGRGLITFIISLLIIAAALGGIYWIYLNFYA